MTQRTDALIRALQGRGYSEVRVAPGDDHRRFRISPSHARRVTVWSRRHQRQLFGDLFLTEGGRLLLGATRRLALAVNQITVENLILTGESAGRHEARVRRGASAKRGPALTLEELLAP